MKYVVAFLIGLLSVQDAAAGPYQDGLTRCMVSNTSVIDQRNLIRWIVLAFASSTAASDMVSIDMSKASTVQKDMAGYTERIFLNDCLLAAREAVRYEGEFAIVEAFKLMSQIAGREAMTDPAAQSVLNGYMSYIDEERLNREVFGR